MKERAHQGGSCRLRLSLRQDLKGLGVWSSCVALLCGPSLWPFCVALLCGPSVWPSCVALLCGPPVWPSVRV